jgi:hypothetical protein
MSTIRMLLTTVMVVTILPPLHAQSLADAAKQAAEQRAKAKQEQSKPAGTKDSDKTDAPADSKKIYSNKDLAGAPAPPVAAPSETKKSEPTEQGSGAPSAAKSDVKNEAYWRDRMTALRTSCQSKASAVKSLEEIEKKKVADARKEMAAACVSCSQTAEIKVTLPAVIQVEIEKAKADLAACNKTISLTEEEARVAGVPPGWVREK